MSGWTHTRYEPSWMFAQFHHRYVFALELHSSVAQSLRENTNVWSQHTTGEASKALLVTLVKCHCTFQGCCCSTTTNTVGLRTVRLVWKGVNAHRSQAQTKPPTPISAHTCLCCSDSVQMTLVLNNSPAIRQEMKSSFPNEAQTTSEASHEHFLVLW